MLQWFAMYRIVIERKCVNLLQNSIEGIPWKKGEVTTSVLIRNIIFKEVYHGSIDRLEKR